MKIEELYCRTRSFPLSEQGSTGAWSLFDAKSCRAEPYYAQLRLDSIRSVTTFHII